MEGTAFHTPRLSCLLTPRNEPMRAEQLPARPAGSQPQCGDQGKGGKTGLHTAPPLLSWGAAQGPLFSTPAPPWRAPRPRQPGLGARGTGGWQEGAGWVLGHGGSVMTWERYCHQLGATGWEGAGTRAGPAGCAGGRRCYLPPVTPATEPRASKGLSAEWVPCPTVHGTRSLHTHQLGLQVRDMASRQEAPAAPDGGAGPPFQRTPFRIRISLE